MSNIVDVLVARKAEIKQSIKTLQTEEREVDIALAAIEGTRAKVSSSVGTAAGKGSATGIGASMSINDGIIEAVKSGADSPSKIFQFLKPHLGIETTKNSVNTRLGKLRENKLIAHRDGRWVPVKNEARPPDGDALQ
jgi:hypothetical protein